jgi:hypothetical protein
MPPGPVYHVLPVPEEHHQAVQAITDMICLEDRIKYAFPLLTNAELPQEQVINASNLPEISEWLTVSFAVSLEKATLEPLVSQFSNILIIPLWRINLDRAIRGERGAAYRLVEPLVERELVDQYLPAEHFRARAEQTGVSAEQARLNLPTDAMLEVVTHRNQRMFLKSAKDSQLLRDSDGRPQTFTPNSIDEYTLRRWAKSEAVKKAEALLYRCPYQPELTIEAIPPDGEPVRLSMPFSGQSLVLPKGLGRPEGSDEFGGTREGFRARIRPVIADLRANGRHGNVAEVAEQTGLSADTLRRARIRYGFPDWRAVINAITPP